jgi:hypothetical protein
MYISCRFKTNGGIKMAFQKLVNMNSDQKNGLEMILREISDNGGKASMMELINDAIAIFINLYADAAVEKYSPLYKTLGSDEE